MNWGWNYSAYADAYGDRAENKENVGALSALGLFAEPPSTITSPSVPPLSRDTQGPVTIYGTGLRQTVESSTPVPGTARDYTKIAIGAAIAAGVAWMVLR